MPRYRYHAKDRDGRDLSGLWEAAEARAAREDLQARGLTLVCLEEEAPDLDGSALAFDTDPGGWDLGVGPKELARFVRQLGALLRAGLPMMHCLALLGDRGCRPSLRRVLASLGRSVQGGRRLSEAMADLPDVFDDLCVGMIRLGESGGRLHEAAERLATLLERDLLLRRRMRKATSYPLFVLVFSGLLAWGLVTFMAPIFAPMFEEAHLDLPRDYPLTYWLLEAGRVLGSPGFLVGALAGAAALGGVGLWLARRRAGRRLGSRVLLAVPFVSGLVRLGVNARAARALAALTRAGLPVSAALEPAGAACGNVVAAEAMEEMARGLQQGQRVSEVMARQAVFLPVLLQMVRVGESSGSLPEMLDRAADFCEEDLDERIDGLLAMLEPLMMVVVGSIVAGFVLALLLPLMALGRA